jgi:hypothetical protein
MIRKTLAGLTLGAAITLGLGSSAAFAGEITGNGKPTPVDDHVAHSICSFSGQNDDPDSTEPFDGGRVQSFGDILKEAKNVDVGFGEGPGASEVAPYLRYLGPGTECRGSGD